MHKPPRRQQRAGSQHLADDRRLAHSLGTITPDRLDGLAAVNRRWLLRGVRATGPAFHPKSYLSVSGRSATLLVGSGNLSIDGLDEGREVFTAFQAGSAEGDRAIAVWQSWMRRIVHGLDDPLLTARFADLEARLPAPAHDPQDAVGSQLVHNLDQPLLEQFVEFVAQADGIDELLLAAPFYDAAADAVTGLVAALRPRRVTVHVTSSTSVDGAVLRQRLAGLNVCVFSYEPDSFTHAKLIGVVAGTQGWIMSGSANLSRAALLTAADQRGNVELAVISRLVPSEVRERFTPRATSVVAQDPEFLDSLVLAADEEIPTLPVRLDRVDVLPDGRRAPRSEPAAVESWALADRDVNHRLVAGPDGPVATAGPVEGRLLHLVDAGGRVISNAVITDDVLALESALEKAGSAPDRGIPPGMTGADLDTPLGLALQILHRELVMDVSERAGAGTSRPDLDDGGTSVETDDDFWARVDAERLTADPRAAYYGQARTPGGSASLLQQILEAMGARLPDGDRASPLDIVLPHVQVPLDEPGATGRQWSLRARTRVRVRNVLRRWAAAQSDPGQVPWRGV